MNNEIKKIINDLQRVADRKCYPEDILCGSIAQEWVDYITDLQEENEHLKYHLNDIVFDDSNIDVELGARLLRKLGYCDFDDKKQVYVNKHNNQPFVQEDTKEKAFYIKDDKLDDYTKQLESDNENYKLRIDKAIEYIELWHYRNDFRVNSFTKGVKEELLDILQGSEKE